MALAANGARDRGQHHDPQSRRRRARRAYACARRTTGGPWKRRRGSSCATPSGARPLPGISRARFAHGSRLLAAWIWSCLRAGPDANRRPSSEAAAVFLLDTNIVSELLRPSPDPAVETWIGDRRATDLYFSAIGEAELRYGVGVLPAGGGPRLPPPSRQSCERTSPTGFSRSTARRRGIMRT